MGVWDAHPLSRHFSALKINKLVSPFELVPPPPPPPTSVWEILQSATDRRNFKPTEMFIVFTRSCVNNQQHIHFIADSFRQKASSGSPLHEGR